MSNIASLARDRVARHRVRVAPADRASARPRRRAAASACRRRDRCSDLRHARRGPARRATCRSPAPSRWKNVHAIAPPMSRPSTFGSSASMTSILPGDLGAAEDRDERPLGFGERARRGTRAPSPSAGPRRRGADARDARGRRSARGARRRTHRSRRGRRARASDRASASSFFSSPARKRVFSSSSISPSLQRVASPRRRRRRRVAVDELHRVPASSSPSRSATGASEYFASGFPFGRPRCESSTTRAPRSQRARRCVGSAARMRVSSVTRAVVVERHVEVDAHERALAARASASREVADRFAFDDHARFWHRWPMAAGTDALTAAAQSRAPMKRSRSTQRDA